MENIYNAIQNVYNMDKTTWQEVLAELYNLVSNVENKFDLFENKFGQLLGEEVIIELKKMYDDGSLAVLINDKLLKEISEQLYCIELFDGENDNERINKVFETKKGGIILLQGKTYYFSNIIVPKGFSIIGSNSTIVKPSEDLSNNPIFRLSGDNTIKNFSVVVDKRAIAIVTGDYGGFKDIGKCDNILISNLRINSTKGTESAICVGYGENILIENNYIKNVSKSDNSYCFGICVHSHEPNVSSNIVIKNNTVEGFYIGINSWGTSRRNNLIVDGNYVSKSTTFGICGYHAHKSRIVNNRVVECGKGIYMDSGSDPILKDDGEGNICSNNQIYGCESIGLFVEEITNGNISCNSITKCDVGLVFGGGVKYSVISSNTISLNRVGILEDDTLFPAAQSTFYNRNIKITSNFISKNKEHGIHLLGAYGMFTIDCNDIVSNNTSDGDFYSIFIDLNTKGDLNKGVNSLLITGNNINNRNLLNEEFGNQKGIKINTSNFNQLIITNNILDCKDTNFYVRYGKAIIANNIVLSPDNTSDVYGGTKQIVNNIGFNEGDLVASSKSGIRINSALTYGTELPPANDANRGRIVKVERNYDDGVDEKYYICKQKGNGTHYWVEIFK